MPIPDSVSPTTPEPTHHLKLTDASGNELLANVVRAQRDGSYATDPTTLQRLTFPNQAVRFTQQGGQYADYQPPWQPFEQDTWEGGRGIRYFHKDKTRYADSYRVLTQTPSQVTLAGAPRFSGGNFQGDQPLEHIYIMPGNFSGHSNRATALYDSDKFIGRRFSPTNSGSFNRILVILGQQGTAPGNFRVDLYSDNAGVPNASLANGTLTVAAFGTDEISKTVSIDLDAAESLTAGTNYWLIVQSVTNGDANNHWWVLTDDTAVGVSARSTNGTVWVEASPYPAPYGAILDRHTATNDDLGFQYFQYKGAWYCTDTPFDGAGVGAVFRNGWRGAADSNVANLNKLFDSTQTTWQNFTIVGGIVKIIKGPGADETKPWRVITAAASGELTVDTPWLTEHTTATEYVVVNTDYWQVVTSGIWIKHVEVAGEFYYLTLADTKAIWRGREYNAAGVWTVAFNIEDVALADQVLSVREPETGRTALYGYNNDHALGPVYWKMYQPPAWGDLYRDLGTILATDTPWNAVPITNVTQSVGEHGTKITVAGAFTTGLIASKDLPTPLDLSEGEQVGFLMHSDVAVTTGQLTLTLSQQFYRHQQSRSKKLMADYVFHKVVDRLEVASKVTTLVPSTGVHTNKPKIFDGSDASSDTIALTTTNKLVAVFAKKVNSVQFNISVANTTDRAVTMRYFNGEEFVLHTIVEPAGWAGTAFGATGKNAITFTLPGDWEQYTVDDGTDAVTGYVLEFIVDGNIDDTTALFEIAGKNTEAYEYVPLSLSHDARDDAGERRNWRNGDELVVGMASIKFDQIHIQLTTPNTDTDADIDAVNYFNGNELTPTASIGSITDGTASGGATMAQDGALEFAINIDWQLLTIGGVTGYFMFVHFDEDMSDDLMLDEVQVYAAEQTYTVDCVLAANTWTWITGSLTPGSNFPEESVIRNVSLTLGANLAAQVIQIKDGLHLLHTGPQYKSLNGHRATNLVAYGSQELIEPFVLFEDQRPHRIDTLNGDALVPILITGLEIVADETNGRAAAHSGVYLYFNLGPRIMRYFEGSLESVGPDLDEGLPFNRQGPISFIIPYPGDAIIYGVDAASRNANFESSVILRSGSGVHELYRAPKGEAIRDGKIQVIKGLAPDRLWLNVGSNLVWIPIPSYTTDPLKDLDDTGTSNFPYTHDGYVDLGYITDGALGLHKVFVSLSLITKNLSAGQLFITAYYRTNATAAWTKVTTAFTTSPDQELAFTTGYVRGKRLQVRLRLRKDGGQGQLTTPVLEGVFIKGITIYPATYQYNLNLWIEDQPQDLAGNVDEAMTAATYLTRLDGWRNVGDVLTQDMLIPPFSSRSVIVQSVGSQVAYLDPQTQKRGHVVNVTLLDITV